MIERRKCRRSQRNSRIASRSPYSECSCIALHHHYHHHRKKRERVFAMKGLVNCHGDGYTLSGSDHLLVASTEFHYT